MFSVYYSNQLGAQKDLLIKILEQDPNPNPFKSETILVQSIGMAQWLQMQIASETGVAGSVQFPYPTSFLWQQYRLLFPELPKENIFERSTMVWRLMRLIPDYLTRPEFASLSSYLQQPDQLKLYQLASKIADLFDQYLVYRPQWLIHWESNQPQLVVEEIRNSAFSKNRDFQDIEQSNLWQSILWNALVADIKKDSDEVIFNTSHRAYLQQRYFDKLENLTEQEKDKLPKRIFVFGISSMPISQLAVLKKLSEYCRVYLFFTNPSEVFWADSREDKIIEKLALNQALSQQEFDSLLAEQGNPLLVTWGKQGKEFLNLLTEAEIDANYIPDFDYLDNESLLTQIKQAIFKFEHSSQFNLAEQDKSIQIHSCHSKMREVEVLHNNLLQQFEQNPDLSPKDIIVMSADIDSYAPYINAVFSRYERGDKRYIPFTLSDQKINFIDPIVASFLSLLTFKERKFTVEEVLDLFDVNAIKDKYQLKSEQLFTLRKWVNNAGIRAGLDQQNPNWQNYNSWENGLNRLLLGVSLKEENNSWQGIISFDESYGLGAELTGHFAKFIDNLTGWIKFIQQPQSLENWHTTLIQLVDNFYQDSNESSDTLLNLRKAIESVIETIQQANFTQEITIDVLTQLFEQQLSEQRSNLNFLVGRVNFCTLLPMRAIPFKMVCLLGMNEGEFPRQQTLNSFDLMQYAPQKGDRARRDDDRYLFLEALLSAQQTLYISYVGQSLTSSAEKLPSVLVSQLTDYINENLADEQKFPVQHHAMTVFSPKNFIDGNISYDKEWLELKNKQLNVDNFLTKLNIDKANLPTEIDLSELIRYLQDPVAYFFNHHLGVYFKFDDQQNLESEHFNLNNLEKYNLRDDLLNLNEEQIENFFNNETLKGNLPVNAFSTIAQNELLESIKSLKSALATYLAKESGIYEIDLKVICQEQAVNLVGNIPNYFGNEIVLWRVGDLRDKDMIQAWVYHLAICANGYIQDPSLKFYYRSNDDAAFLEFYRIEREQARELLAEYIADYLASFSELKWALTTSLTSYFKNIKDLQEETSRAERCQRYVESLDSVYMQRILAQTDKINWVEIHQRTMQWFALMSSAILKK
ncbi:exodeoxyribonuclease V subunit gamma [Pasteurellaceae bacterium LFhippo2]|nr:exodeoxyribonuclease V subunit gamma [Pasteurellaceae bacterium LFhippo2]